MSSFQSGLRVGSDGPLRFKKSINFNAAKNGPQFSHTTQSPSRRLASLKLFPSAAGNVRPPRRQQERNKLKQLAAPPQTDLFG